MANLKKNDKKEDAALDYGYYSKKLNKVFDNLIDLEAAELKDAKEKEEKAAAAAAKKNDASEVERAYKNLNAARKAYKENLEQAMIKHAAALKVIQDELAADKTAITNKLAEAEKKYEDALKNFTDKHPEGFHLTLKDGDYETSISRNTSKLKGANDPVVDFLLSWFPFNI